MAGDSKDRVRKYRALKCSTAEGHQDMKEKNKVYKARSRRKNKIKRLSKEKATLVATLPPAKQIYIDNKSLLFRAGLLRARGGGALGKDAQQEVDIEVLAHEINLAKVLKEREKFTGLVHLPHLPFLDEDLAEDGELLDALSTSFGSVAQSTYTPPKDLFGTADSDDANDVLDVADDANDDIGDDGELFPQKVSSTFGGNRAGGTQDGPMNELPSSMEAAMEGLYEKSNKEEISDESMFSAFSNSVDRYLQE